jgi:NAD(P)-dependent dehydrogenase (short-subunit alcohol dehydrogenase family)
MFKNKIILISGSSGLIGNHLKKFYLSKGAKVIGLDLNKKDKYTIECNITDEVSVKNAFDLISKKYETIDLLINNASKNPVVEKIKNYKFSDYSLAKWKNGLDVDLVGSFLLSKYALKIFEKKNKGKIINISSMYGLIGPDQSIYGKQKKYHGFKPIEYSVAKAGLIGFTKALSAYYKYTNIEVLCLIFGGIEDNQSKKFKNNYLKKTIKNRLCKISEVIDYVSFFSSSKSSYSDGASIIIDGGATSII